MLAQVSIFPTDQGESVGEHVARVVRLIADSGLAFRVTAMGTEIDNVTEFEELASGMSDAPTAVAASMLD